jgi:hypothetical protein
VILLYNVFDALQTGVRSEPGGRKVLRRSMKANYCIAQGFENSGNCTGEEEITEACDKESLEFRPSSLNQDSPTHLAQAFFQQPLCYLHLSAFFILLQETINHGMPVEDFMLDGYVTDDLSNPCLHRLDRFEVWRLANRGEKILLIPVVV